MKLRTAITGLLAMLVAANLQATTLKLSDDIDLLVLDGRKISGSLLKGADGLELERGEHQLVFRVAKKINKLTQAPLHWQSAPQIATFTARSSSVVIKLPPLETLREVKHFNHQPQFTLVDGYGAEVSTKRDRLAAKMDGSLEQEMRIYNQAGKVASVLRFARPLPPDTQIDKLNGMTSSLHPVLPLWLLQVDAVTRQRLIMLMNALHTS